MKNKNRPEWVPEGASDEFFTTNIMTGVDLKKESNLSQCVSPFIVKKKKKQISLQEYKEGVLAGNKTMLAQAITLIESNAPKHFDMAQQLISELLPHAEKSYRIGITGVPGAGKSTFIEAFGTMLTKDLKKKTAVLAVDPSSSITGGSVLGDKTRMENLSREKLAFIRPSPSGGVLGGVARKSRETIVLCEAAGYEVILIETVGVGQSEVTVRTMTDFFLLIQLATQGDELQGIKKGVIELADAILVNKCDGNMMDKAMLKKAELTGVLQYLQSPTVGWKPFCDVCSAYTGLGIKETWQKLDDFRKLMNESGEFNMRRLGQRKEWFKALLEVEILRDFYNKEGVKDKITHYQTLIERKQTTIAMAVKNLIGL